MVSLSPGSSCLQSVLHTVVRLTLWKHGLLPVPALLRNGGAFFPSRIKCRFFSEALKTSPQGSPSPQADLPHPNRNLCLFPAQPQIVSLHLSLCSSCPHLDYSPSSCLIHTLCCQAAIVPPTHCENSRSHEFRGSGKQEQRGGQACPWARGHGFPSRLKA